MKENLEKAKKEIIDIEFVEFNTNIADLKKLGWQFDDETPDNILAKVTFQYEEDEITGLIEVWDDELFQSLF